MSELNYTESHFTTEQVSLLTSTDPSDSLLIAPDDAHLLSLYLIKIDVSVFGRYRLDLSN